MNSKEISRYDRQFLLKHWNQEKISEAKILIVGMGAIGCPSAVNFALMGVGTLILCDLDTIELSNLSRQLLYREDDIDKFKVDVAAERLKALNPEIDIITYNTRVEKLDPKIFEAIDVIIDGLDNFEARQYLNSMAIDKQKPLIHGGTFGWHGNVQVIIPFQTACMQCQPLIPESRLKKPCSPLGKIRKEEDPAQEMEEKEDEKLHFPSINTVSMIISSIQCQEAIKILLGIDNPMKDFLFYDSLTQKFTYVPLARNKHCIVCGENRLTSKKFALDLEETVQQVKKRIAITYNIPEHVKLSYRGIILEDINKIKETEIEENGFIYVFDKSMDKPLKLQITLS